MMKDKIVTMDGMEAIAGKLKREGKKIVHCHGVFDLLHPGHIKHFEAAKRYGDVLVVSLTEDEKVNKGPDRPVFNEALRAEAVAAIAAVDYVTVNRAATAVPAIEAIKPDFYVKGQDYKESTDDVTGGIIDERKAVESTGGELVFTEEVQFSSSGLINRYLPGNREETKAYLERKRSDFDFEAIKKRFDEIANYKVLVIGDIILDEYQFVSPMGKASKAAAITAKKLNTELYAGGALAVANHIADFVQQVTLLSAYGLNARHDYLDFIKKHLHKNVNFIPVFTPERPTTLKRRFVESVFKHKLFEVAEIDDSPLDEGARQKLFNNLDKAEDGCDAIVVADFGHGLIDKETVDNISGKNLFLSVNTQTNSANRGFNILTKYPKCDYFSIDEEEARLALQDRFAGIESILTKLVQQTGAQKGAITLGVKGCIVSGKDSGSPVQAPVLSENIVDTIGAGDAFLSVTSLLARQGAPIEEIAFVGNAVGAMAVKILGNKSYIEKISLLKYLKTLLS